MKIRIERLAAITGAMALCFGIPAFGQGKLVTMSLTDVNGASVINVGDQSAFGGVLGGTSNLVGANSGIISDDFNAAVTTNVTWTARAYQVSSLGSGANPISDVLFGGSNLPGYASVGLTGYAEMAYLVNLSFNSTGNSALQGEISEAIWSITDPGLAATIDSSALALLTAAQNYVAKNGNSLSQYTNLIIYAPNPTAVITGNGQEMWGRRNVPEGGSALLYLMLAGVSCFGAICFRFGRQAGTSEAA